MIDCQVAFFNCLKKSIFLKKNAADDKPPAHKVNCAKTDDMDIKNHLSATKKCVLLCEIEVKTLSDIGISLTGNLV